MQPGERFLRVRDVAALIGLGSTKIWEMAARGDFPRPRKLGPTVTVWRESEVRAWMDDAWEKAA